jgi:DNA-binding NtrC family response regulator
VSDGAEAIRVLLVDDEVEFLEATAKALSRRGFVPVTAPGAAIALSLLDERVFDVAVLDVKMPDMDGEQLFAEIRKRHAGLPVVILTGHGTIQQAFRTSKEGVVDYLSKPIDVDELAAMLRGAVDRMRARAVHDRVRQVREILERSPD